MCDRDMTPAGLTKHKLSDSTRPSCEWTSGRRNHKLRTRVSRTCSASGLPNTAACGSTTSTAAMPFSDTDSVPCKDTATATTTLPPRGTGRQCGAPDFEGAPTHTRPAAASCVAATAHPSACIDSNAVVDGEALARSTRACMQRTCAAPQNTSVPCDTGELRDTTHDGTTTPVYPPVRTPVHAPSPTDAPTRD